MNVKSKIVCSAAILLCTVALATVVPGLQAKRANLLAPFVGMAQLWSNNDNGRVYYGEVNVLQYNQVAGTVLINDALYGALNVSVTTREIIWGVGIYADGGWNPFWIPTDVKVGSVVKIFNFDATVTGTTSLSVQGTVVSCWEVRYTQTGGDGSRNERTFLYEKNSGLLLAMVTLQFDPLNSPVYHYASFVVSTNFPF